MNVETTFAESKLLNAMTQTGWTTRIITSIGRLDENGVQHQQREEVSNGKLLEKQLKKQKSRNNLTEVELISTHSADFHGEQRSTKEIMSLTVKAAYLGRTAATCYNSPRFLISLNTGLFTLSA